MAVKRIIEMANARKSDTGLPVNIWLDEIGDRRNNKHNIPRIKVQADKRDKAYQNMNWIPVSIPQSIQDSSRILIKHYKSELSNKEWQIVFDFIYKEQEILMKHWRGEISSGDAIIYFKTIARKD